MSAVLSFGPSSIPRSIVVNLLLDPGVCLVLLDTARKAHLAREQGTRLEVDLALSVRESRGAHRSTTVADDLRQIDGPAGDELRLGLPHAFRPRLGAPIPAATEGLRDFLERLRIRDRAELVRGLCE